jgi:hypothetical protein
MYMLIGLSVESDFTLLLTVIVYICKENIKTDFIDILLSDLEWIHLAQDKF